VRRRRRRFPIFFLFFSPLRNNKKI
jgi:hypothetical protein